jgi:tetratricopeptide (TPR) repeat protein
MCRELGEHLGAADTLGLLGEAAVARERYSEAAALFAERLKTYQALHVRSNLVWALVDCGEVAQHLGDFAAAQTYYDTALTEAQDIGRPETIVDVLYVLGNLARRMGDYDRAEARLRQGLALAGRMGAGSRLQHAYLRRALGAVARCRGDWRGAAAEYGASLAMLREIEQPERELILVLRELALACAAVGRPGEALRLFAASEAATARVSLPVPPVDRDEYQRSLAMARAAVGNTVCSAAWEAGGAMPLEQAAASGLEALTAALPAQHPPGPDN